MQDTPVALPHGNDPPEYDFGEPLPDWVFGLYTHQVDAIREAVDHYANGADVVFMNAPVGSGKTLMGDVIPRELARMGLLSKTDRTLYICSDKALQRQFDRDFPYARLLMGRSNYSTLDGPSNVSCEDCTSMGPGDDCMHCDPVYACPYRVAKVAALGARTAVLNTAMLLTIANFTRDFRSNEFVVADEADTLEDSLLGFSEFEIPAWICREVGLSIPKKGVHKPTLIRWLQEAADLCNNWFESNGTKLEPKQQRRMGSFIQEVAMVAGQLQIDVNNAKVGGEDDDSYTDEGGHWIREYDTKTLKLLPVTVDAYGTKHLWRHGRRWLLMSGTIISADGMADDLGLPLDYGVVNVPSPFPVENRPVILAPIASMTAKSTEDDYEKMAYAIERIVERHPGRVLIHTNSYRLNTEMVRRCDLGRRWTVTYNSAFEKQKALAEYLSESGAVMFAPSMDRGVDLKGDACECMIIVKCPYPNLGDKQVSARTKLPNGWNWYARKTVAKVVQMSGRGVRTPTDVCPTYILDSQFTSNTWRKDRKLFPTYFAEAVDARQDIRWMMKDRRR